LLTTSRETIDRIFTKILPEMSLWTSKVPSNFGSHLLRNPDLRISWRILQHCKRYLFFHSSGHISGKKPIASSWRLYRKWKSSLCGVPKKTAQLTHS